MKFLALISKSATMTQISTKRLKEYPSVPVSLAEYKKLSFSPEIDLDDCPLDWDYEKVANEFFVDGVTCFPILEPEEIVPVRNRVILAIANAKEFKEPDSLVRQLDKFGALGIASSFHHPELRELRRALANRSIIFKRAFARKIKKLPYFSELLDRLSFRRVGTEEFKQTAHTDTTPLGIEEKDDVIAGGILNLNDHDIFFSCIPGSFKVPDKSHHAGFNKTSETIGMKKIKIPPGYRCVFRQTIVHEVHSKKVEKLSKDYYGQFRLYQGIAWRKSSGPVFGAKYLDHVFKEQCSPLLPSGQRPLIYSPNYSTYFPIDVQVFANSFVGSMRSPTNILYPSRSMCPFADLDKKYEKTSPKEPYVLAELMKTHKKIPSLKFLDLHYEPWTEDEVTPFYGEK